MWNASAMEVSRNELQRDDWFVREVLEGRDDKSFKPQPRKRPAEQQVEHLVVYGL